ncbi:IgGFc-binding protein-like [Stegostoma tigrinum]|uniref:IgGFc-binding protein-like n=1 Tax=Stegostoma tigrinum TaxID=3053191 RepID=UPI00287056F8|nr:IgGFc-binding protein-like [Stegostoma tigrinum]
MAVYFSPGCKRRRQSGYDPFLIALAPSDQLANSYVSQGLPGFLNFLTVVSRSNETGHVLLDEKAGLHGATWKAIPGSEYSWVEIALGLDHGKHEVRTAPGQGIAVYKFGVANMNAYGSQANAEGQQGAHDQCYRSQCGGQEPCTQQNGSLCWVFGDPHYRTFDGMTFDFQGTCSYTLATRCGNDSSMPAFEIQTKNENHGTNWVSVVQMVTVNVHGHTVTAGRQGNGKITVSNLSFDTIPNSEDLCIICKLTKTPIYIVIRVGPLFLLSPRYPSIPLFLKTHCLLPLPPASCPQPPASCPIPLPPAPCLLPPASCPQPAASCPLPPAPSPLPPAPCPLPPAPCPLPPAPCLLPHPTASCPLPPARCLLPPARCLLPPASCPLPPASCPQPPASCPIPLPPAPCLLPPARCLLPPASCPQPTASCPLPPASCPLSPAPCPELDTQTLCLEGGKLNVYHSGAYIVLETDFHLRVIYDWNSHLVVKIPTDYSGKVCGLCGNFDRDARIEFLTPSGTLAPNPLEFGRSWRVDAANATCWDDCKGPCKACEAGARNWDQDPKSCGLLAQAGGPFRECHSTVKPDQFVQGCAHDLCRSQGFHRFLCQAMKAYTEICQRQGLRIHEWRSLVNCPLQCPENSHYEACGTACPATCSDPKAPATCQLACVESCVCNQGYVLSVGQCIPAEKCGCTYNGRYYKAGQSFWEDHECQSRCQCDAHSKKVECVSRSCGTFEKCRVVKGVRGCHAISYSTCTAVGDPHYHTFDNLKFDFMGTCVYQFTSFCSNRTDLVPFDIQVQNENRVNKAVSFTRLSWVVVYGTTIVFSREHVSKALVNGILENLPITLENGKINIYKSCRGATLETDFGMRVTFDFRSRIAVTLPGTYVGSVCGLCGNFDGKAKGEMMMRDGTVTDDPVKFGESWQVAKTPGCSHMCRGRCPKCDIVALRRYGNKEFCGKIRSTQGPFRECLSKVNPTHYFDDCLYDSCLYKGHHAILCESLAAYTAVCQEAGVHITPWRNRTFCPMPCPANSHYEACGTGCPMTCCTLSEPESCNVTCGEGCQCDDGFVLSGEDCVPLGKCGCLYQDSYYRLGQTFFPRGKCGERCVCQDGGIVKCHEMECGPNEECKVVAGVRGCYSITSGWCTIAGDLHYRTFDGVSFNFQGSCTYTLATVCQGGEDLPNFTVTARNQQLHPEERPVTSQLEVHVHGYALTLERSVRWRVKVNGTRTNLPLRLSEGRIIVYQLGHRVQIQTEFGLNVSYDLSYSSRVTVPGRYKGRICGLCGNFNDKKEDDLVSPAGKDTKGVTDFVQSWSTPGPGEACKQVDGKYPLQCPKNKTAVLQNAMYCEFLGLPSGPLSVCHSTVDPQPFIRDCLFDTCHANGNTQVLCHSLRAYMDVCQAAAGINLNNQAQSKLCTMKCPENSHYEACADTCATTCAGVTEFANCPETCNDGCQCDEGFYANGDTCVPIEKCGCFENGHYYQPNEVSIQDNCKLNCTCSMLGLECEEMACAADEFCEIRTGVHGCYSKGKSCRLSVPESLSDR